MNSNILILPVIRIEHSNPDWIEQYEREREAAMMNELVPPPRTRPIVVAGQMIGCQRPEGER